MSHLDLVTIICEKLEETKQFYIERLGFSVVEQFSSPAGDFYWLRSERTGTSIALQDVRTRSPKPTLAEIPMVRGGLMFGFPVENARVALKEWQEAGLPTRTDIFDMKKGETFGAYDPEGNFIQLYDVYPQFKEIQQQLVSNEVITVSLTLAEVFEQLADQLDVQAADGINRTIEWHITDHDPGVWALAIADGKGRLIPGGVADPDCTFTSTTDTWLSIAEGRVNPMRAFMNGKLKVSGDMMLALKMPKLFPNAA